jgi:hypothetical protein
MEKEEIKKLLSQIGLVSYVKSKGKSQWYVVPVDYWVMNHWGQWGISWEINDEEKGEIFLGLIDKFKMSNQDVISFYSSSEGIERNKFIPQIYADFDNMKFHTSFGEWVLEAAVLDSWTGIRSDVKELIEDTDKYWIQSTEST